MHRLKWFFMSRYKKLLYAIKCAKSNEQRLHLENGIVLDFTEEKENLLKERAGLKLHCAEYKRKYKALDRVLHREVWYRIEGIKVQYSMIADRLSRATDEKERLEMQTILRCLSKERENLQNIYDMCKEVSK